MDFGIEQASIDTARKSLDEVVDRLFQGIDGRTAALIPQLSNIVGGVGLALQSSIDSAFKQAAEMVASQDGWTLEITIPAITVRLTKPKAGA